MIYVLKNMLLSDSAKHLAEQSGNNQIVLR